MTKYRRTEEVDALGGSRGGNRRESILEAFHDCILKKGYAKTTLRDVARTAGMTASHLLYYFAGKDAILEHYFDVVSRRIMKRIDSFRDGNIIKLINRLKRGRIITTFFDI